MLHLGCMDYSKLTFPMPMTGGGILSGHIFARVAAAASCGLYDKSSSSAASSADLDVEVLQPMHRAVPSDVVVNPSFDYDYIAEWVNHRSDEVGLQLDFIDAITEIVDELRNVDRPLRTDTLKAQLFELENTLSAHSDWFGFDPTGAATEPRYKVEHFVLSDCRVFRTKARAPSLVACIVRRDDTDMEWSMETLLEQRHRSRTVSSDHVSQTPTGADRSTLAEHPDDIRASVGVFHRAEGQTVAAELAAAEGMLEQLSSSKCVAQTIERVRAGSEEAVILNKTTPPTVVVDTMEIENIRISSSTPPADRPDGTPTSRRGSRLASHAKTRNMSLLHQSKSIEKELDSNFGTSADDGSTGTGHDCGPDVVGNGEVPRAHSLPVIASEDHLDPVEENDSTSVIENAEVIHRDQTPLDSSPGKVRHISIDKNTASKSLILIDSPETQNGSVHSKNSNPPLSPNSAARAVEEAAEEERLNAEVTKKVVASARALLVAGKISEKEFDTLINCDTRYRDEAVRTELEIANVRLEECFGEPWEEHKERILADYVEKRRAQPGVHHSFGDEHAMDSPWPELDLRWFIVKSNDDLRQEVCCLQLIELCQEIFADVTSHGSTAKCDLWLKTYRIGSTNSTTGVVQVIPDTMSLDALKKTEGFISLPKHFERVYGTSSERLHEARRNFVASLAAYSVVSYIFQIKDRHNGNILLDREGHIIHIDFGFLLGIAPGGSFSIESAPFKLTEEMVDTFGGLDSSYFSDFLRAFTSGFLALRANSETIVSTLSLMSTQSTFPCFAGKDTNLIIDKLRGRFRTDLSVKDTVQHCLDLIIESYSHYGTKQYDNFQWLTNGIVQ